MVQDEVSRVLDVTMLQSTQACCLLVTQKEAEEISTADLKHAVAEIKQKGKLFWYCRDIAVTYKVCAYLYLFFK